MTGTRALLDAASAASADWLVRTSWQAGVLIVAVVAIQLLLGHKRLPPKWAYALWMLVVVRLLMPAVPQSSWSVFNLEVPSWTRGIEVSRSGTTGSAAEAATPRKEPARIPEGTRVTVGIIDGPERHVTSSVVVATPIAPQPATPPITRTAFDWKLSVMMVWLVGVAVAIARLLAGVLTLRRRIGHGREADSETLVLLDHCCFEMGLSKRTSPRVVVTDAVSGPALFGFFRPVLLVPPHLLVDLSREELRFVLLHELAHLRRRDPLANALLVLVSAVHWFNPLVRFALTRLRAERELACDEFVMSCVDRSPATDAPASEYGQAVLRVAQALRPSARRVPVATVGMIHTRSQLRRRIAMIATYTPPAVGRRSSRLPRVALPVLLVLLVASCALTDGATKPPATKPASDSSNGAQASKSESFEKSGATLSLASETYVWGISAADRAMQADLDRTLPELKFDGVAFSDVMESLRDQCHLNLLVDWRALESAGIDRNTPVTIRVRDVKFSKALRIILDSVGGDTVKLGYAIDGNILNVSTADALAKDTVMRIYDIRDLIIEIPNFTEAPKFSVASAQPPQSRPAQQPASDEERRAAHIKEITDLVQETVDVDSWRENGGSVGSMRVLQGQLIVTQTQENQNAIFSLLEQLREGRSIQVTVETRFLTLDPAKAEESVRRRLAPSFENSGGSSGKPAATFLSDDELQAVLRAANEDRQSTIITAPRLTLFNGQRAFVKIATQQAYVSGFTAVKASGGETRWEPTNDIAETGINMDVEATVSADRKFAVLTLRPKLSRLDAVSSKSFDGPADAPKGLFVQVPHVTVQDLLTTVSVPDRQTLLLGGFAENAPLPGGDATTRPTGNVYMLVKPTLIVQREIQVRAK